MERAPPPAAYSLASVMISQPGQVCDGQEHMDTGAAAFEAAGWDGMGWDGTGEPGLFLVLFLSEAEAKWPQVILFV